MTGAPHLLLTSLFPLRSPHSPPTLQPSSQAMNNDWCPSLATDFSVPLVFSSKSPPVISKSIERAARVQFENTSLISDQNCTTRGSITTLLHTFWNRSNAGLGQFKYFIDAVLSRFEIKLIHFLGGKSKNFGNKSSKICHTILFVYHFPAIWLVLKTSLEIWLVFLFLVWPAHWLGKRCD